MMRFAEGMSERFGGGAIEPFLPNRTPGRRTFSGVVERAKHRRREIGAFLRGLDLGHTETSHMDAHGEASLQSLMEWAARLEILAEADEPDKADYGQFHRVLDQLDNTTEDADRGRRADAAPAARPRPRLTGPSACRDEGTASREPRAGRRRGVRLLGRGGTGTGCRLPLRDGRVAA